MTIRLIAALFAFAVAASACGGSDDATTSDATPATDPAATSADPTTPPTTTSTTTAAPPTTTVVTTTTAAGPVPELATYEVEVTSDVVYGTGAVRNGEIDLMAKLFVPVDAVGPHPVYIHLPGGGFQFSDANNSGPAKALAERGFVAAAFDYRVQGDDPIPSERVGGIYDSVGGADGGGLGRAIAAAVEDGLLGTEWLLAQAEELDLDLDRVVLGGGSAGAITANHISYTAEDFGFERPSIAAAVDLWGGFTLAKPAETVTGDEPPVFIVHGTEDNVVSYTFTEDFVAAAEAAGLPYEVYPVQGAGHGVDLVATEADDGVTLFDHMVAWLRTTLYPAA
ncbi:MAG: alpha/beta hydrolase [Acidimicrobiales bacterium]